MSQFKFQTFFLFFLLTLTIIVGCGGTDQSPTTTQNDEDEQGIEDGGQQNDVTANINGEETEEDTQASEPITETVSDVINEANSTAYFRGYLPALHYNAYEFDGSEGQTFETTIDTYGQEIGAGGIFLYKTDDFNYEAESYKEAALHLTAGNGLIGSLQMVLPESTSYTLFVAVSMDHVKEDGINEVDYTLTWTIE